MFATVEQLFIYPVKSLAGVAVNQITLTSAGAIGDREWMLVNESGQFVTQRQLPQLSTLGATPTVNGLRLSTNNGLHHEVFKEELQEPVNVKVWRDTCEAFLASDATHQWLNKVVPNKQSLRLVYFNKNHTRATDTARFGNHSTYFADAAPYLIANSASLHALNLQLEAQGEDTVGIERFRPNIVISGLPAFAEHANARLISSEGTTIKLIDHCQRCSIITIDPAAGALHPHQSPFKTLAAINPMPNNPKAPAFGVNAVLESGSGNSLELLQTLKCDLINE